MDIYDFLHVLSILTDIGFKIGILCLISQYLKIRSIKQWKVIDMRDDIIEDVYDAVNWLRRHGVEVNDNRVKEDYETSKSKGYKTRRRVVEPRVFNSKDIRSN